MTAPAKPGPIVTRTTIDGYFADLKEGKDWQRFFADDLVFTSRTSPVRQLAGRETIVQATQRFYSMISQVDVRRLIIDGDRACALTRYVLTPPSGPSFESDVAEIFQVRDGEIATFDIYFDSAPYPKQV